MTSRTSLAATATASQRISVREAVLGFAVWGSAVAVTATFAWLLIDVVWQGVGSLSWSFLVAEPSDAGRAGGIGPILVSTLLILTVCMAISVPIGLAVAALLADLDGTTRFARLVRRSLDILASVPSIVFGLFGNAFFCLALGLGYSILSGGLTLACMVLPIFIRITEEGLRAVPAELRRGAAALGMSRATTLWRVVLPVALPAIVAGIALGVGRAIAETAALIFTSGYVDRMPGSLLDSGRAMAIHIYDLSMNVPGGNANAYATALILISVLLVINLGVAALGHHLTPGARNP